MARFYGTVEGNSWTKCSEVSRTGHYSIHVTAQWAKCTVMVTMRPDDEEGDRVSIAVYDGDLNTLGTEYVGLLFEGKVTDLIKKVRGE